MPDVGVLLSIYTQLSKQWKSYITTQIELWTCDQTHIIRGIVWVLSILRKQYVIFHEMSNHKRWIIYHFSFHTWTVILFRSSLSDLITYKLNMMCDTCLSTTGISTYRTEFCFIFFFFLHWSLQPASRTCGYPSPWDHINWMFYMLLVVSAIMLHVSN